MTGMETVSMMPCTMSGSLIRETPPWVRMSAGTRSRAITATAPASSAILACSGVTTSMMTPPLSISAIPRLTLEVPVAGTLMVVSCADKTVPLPGVSRGFWVPTHIRASETADDNRQFVVDLEGLRQVGVARQPQQAHARLTPHPLYVGHGVIEKSAGQLHPLVGRGHPLEDGDGDGLVLSKPSQRLVAQGQFQRLGQVTLDGFAGALISGIGLQRVGCCAGKDQSA